MTLRILAAAALSLLISVGIAQAHDIQIEHQYARAASPIAKTGASFMHIMNNSAIDDTLIAIRTDAAMQPEIHNHIMENGVAKMRQIEGGIFIEAGKAAVLERGGLHVMMMGLTHPFIQGETISMTLVFEHAGEITIEVPIDNERQANMEMDHSKMDHSAMEHSCGN